MKFSALIILLFAIAGCCNHEQKSEKPGHNDEFWAHRFVYNTDIQYGKGEDQKLDVYSQGQWVGEPNYWKSDSVLHPTFVYIHGGGWLGGSKDNVTFFIMPYMQKGYNVVNIEYGKGEGSAPLAVNDCMLAFKWIVRNAKEYNIDLNNIYVSGESAGGHLALITGLLNSEPGKHPLYCGDSLKIKGIVNWFGITDIAAVEKFLQSTHPEWNYARQWVGNPSRMDSISKIYSPIHNITKNSPPIISIQGGNDSVVPPSQAIALHKVLDQQKIRNELILIKGGKHLGFSNEGFQDAYTRIFKFIGN